ncbi:MAG: DUF4280 domain-containing protein [Sideroxydans sp.]|nr:DUF4280 domain-containing protein [Sideroxydans sp.]
MGNLVCMGAQLQCTCGAAPSSLMVLPTNRVMSRGVPVANSSDHAPFVNILPFAMCSSLANPAVVAATAFEQGVLTPMPCIPVTPAPWTNVSGSVKVANLSTLSEFSKLMCQHGGEITIAFAGQASVNTPSI